MQSFLYGAFLLLFAVYVYLELVVLPTTYAAGHNRLMGSSNIILLVTLMILCLLITPSWMLHVLFFIRMFEEDGVLPLARIFTAQIALYIVQTFVTDLIMIYRLYIVWDHTLWICIFPILCWLAGTGSGISVITIVHSDLNLYYIYPPGNPESTSAIITFCATLALNLFCTVMISIRIWAVSRHVAKPQSRLFRPIRIIIDSATIYTSLYLATLMVYSVKGSELPYVATGIVYCTPPAAGLSFCLIMVRVNFSRIQDQITSVNQSPLHAYPLSSASRTVHQTVIDVKRDEVWDGVYAGGSDCLSHWWMDLFLCEIWQDVLVSEFAFSPCCTVLLRSIW